MQLGKNTTQETIDTYFLRVDNYTNNENYHTFVTATSARYLPTFNASEYEASNLLELYKIGNWVYKEAKAGADEFGNSIGSGNTPAIITSRSSYDEKNKTLTVTGGHFGMTVYDEHHGKYRPIVESDIPEIRMQTTNNIINIEYGIALNENWKTDPDIVNHWQTNGTNIKGVTKNAVYGYEIPAMIEYAPKVEYFEATSDKRFAFYDVNGQLVKDYTNSGMNYNEIVQDCLKTSGNNQGSLKITTMYDATGLSTVYVIPKNGSWVYNGVKYTEENPAVITKQTGSEFSLNNLDATAINFYATFNGNGGTPNNAKLGTNLTWNQSNGWAIYKGDDQGNIIAGKENGAIINNNYTGNDYSYNYLLGFTDHDAGKYYNSSGSKGSVESWFTCSLSIPAGTYYFPHISGGLPCSYLPGLGWGKWSYSVRTVSGGQAKLSVFSLYGAYQYSQVPNTNTYYVDCPNYDGGYEHNAIWKQITTYGYVYKFGEVSGVTDVLVPNVTGTTTVTLPSATKTGSSLVGWKLNYDPNIDQKYLDKLYAAGEIVDLAIFGKDVTFNAVWSDTIYTITLNRDGIMNLEPLCNDGDTVLYNQCGLKFYTNANTKEEVTSIQVPTKSGYTFGGYWSKDGQIQYIDDTGMILVDNDVFSEDITLYAKWTQKNFRISVDTCMNTKNLVNAEEYTKYFYELYCIAYEDVNGKTITSITAPRCLGYVFKGYYTERNGAGTQVIDTYGNIITDASFFEEPTTIYAYWANEPYEVIIDFNDGVTKSESLGDTNKVFYGSNIIGNKMFENFLYTPNRTGYQFAGWYDEPVGGNLVYNTLTGKVLSGSKYWRQQDNGTWFYQYYDAMTLYAHWTPNTYGISYNGNGATDGEMSNSSAVYNKATNLSLNEYINSWTLNFEDGQNTNESSTNYDGTSITKDVPFEGWNANIKKTNRVNLSNYTTCVGNLEAGTQGTVSFTISDEAGIGNYSVSPANGNTGITDISVEGTTVTVTYSTQTASPNVDIIISVPGNDKYEPATSTYHLFGSRKPIVVTLDYGEYGTGDVSSFVAVVGEQYSGLPTAADIKVTNKTDTFIAWTTVKDDIKTKVIPTDIVTSTTDITLYALYDHQPLVETPLQIYTYTIDRQDRSINITGLTAYGKTLEYLVIPDYYWIDGEQYYVTRLSWTNGGTNNTNAPNTRLKYMYISGHMESSIEGEQFSSKRTINISANSFAGCTNLISCYWGGKLPSVPSGTFDGCTNLRNVYIGDSVTKIGMYAFYDCVNLPNLLIPDSVTDLTEGMVIHNRSALGATNSPTRNSALTNVYVSKNASIRNAGTNSKTYSIAPHQGYSIHTRFYSDCSESVINSHASGNAWWRYTLNNGNDSNAGNIAPYSQMSAASFKTNYLNTAEYLDMEAGFPNRPASTYEYIYIQ